jgi:hypothetical protein
MKTVYCISGLGADEKIFHPLQIDAKMKFIPWLQPFRNENIQKYAKRMAESITQPSPVLLGISFGGMIGIEIAKLVNVEKIIVISSVKSANELPQWMRISGKFYLHKVLPTRSYKFTKKFDNDRLGITNEEELNLVNSYRKKLDPVYFNWAVHQVLNWKNNWHPENIIQIHGDKDKIFPIKKLKPTHVIKGGTHIMILNKTEELSKCINSVL